MKTLSIVSLLGAVVLATVAAQDDPQALRPVGSAATIRHTYAVVFEDGEIVNAHFLSDKTVTSSRVASQFVHRLDGGGGPTDPVPPTPGTLGQATLDAFGKITSPNKDKWASVYSQIPYGYIRDGLTQGVFGDPPDQGRVNTVLDSSFAIATASDDWKAFRSEVSAAMGKQFAGKPISAAALSTAFDQVAAALKSVSAAPATTASPQIEALFMMAETYRSTTTKPIKPDQFAMWMQIIQLLLPLIMAWFNLG